VPEEEEGTPTLFPDLGFSLFSIQFQLPQVNSLVAKFPPFAIFLSSQKKPYMGGFTPMCSPADQYSSNAANRSKQETAILFNCNQ
jgi:hypothetical protein